MTDTQPAVKTTDRVQLKPGGNPRRMVYVLAHPDDESFGSGRGIAYYADHGVDVYLICATRGEAGLVDERHLNGHDSIAELRTAELACAAGHLGLTAIDYLNYRDSGMQGSEDNDHPDSLYQAPLDDVAQRVATLLRQIRPQVVVTFDPCGGYRHPDHIRIHQATVRAWDIVNDPAYDDGNPPWQPQRLFYTTIPRFFLRMGVWLSRLSGRDPHKFGRNGDIDLVALLDDAVPLHYYVPVAAYRKHQEDASQCHASQLGETQSGRGPIAWLSWWIGRYDRYSRAQPPVADDYRASDLFFEVKDDNDATG